MSEPGDVVVIAPLSIKNNAPSPICRTNEILGSIKTVDNITARDAIPDYNRMEGMLCYVIDVDKFYQLKDDITNLHWVEASLGAIEQRTTGLINPTAGQTIFTLPVTPVSQASVEFLINAVNYPRATTFTVSGDTVTWLDVPFSLDGQDAVEIKYWV